ncbi:MAG: 4-(cytidine 5'-diphospho)-2-C-methyl-D-erythritol kinase [Spirochaetaceae bacterium]|nr:4-(cytidine 5'-diphospho)-2-C-methyl-D-erythritol kinase [Spirochaetaceae bacterium]MBP5328587.1 4-(cytidine 5'-diphospho)-2-C-methyl-D-erythritol kinase [Spirochaetaceae bacterium]
MSYLLINAPAKLNLNLSVLQKRLDGFHSIESIFQKISLCDELKIEPTDASGCILSVEGMSLPESNTVTKAYDEFVKATGITTGTYVSLKKRIPGGAGLGGGSSDAAAMLIGLDNMFKTGLSQAKLMQCAENIGSDVPFFVQDCSCALVSGRGEIIRPIAARGDLHFVVVYPDVHSSTKEAYVLVDEWNDKTQGCNKPVLSELEDIYNKQVGKWSFVNDFTKPLTCKYPLIMEALNAIKAEGAGFYDMSGSGSAVFGVFDARESAENAYKKLSSYWKNCYLTEGCR